MNSFASRIENIITAIGKLVSWSIAVLLVAIVFQVLMRYALGLTNTMLEDSLWYLFAITLTLGLSYTMTHDGHVRVDFLYQHFSLKTKAIVDVLGIALFVIPLYAFLLWHGWDYTKNSMSINESSPNPSGMPWLWIIKGLLPFSSLLLLIESVARIVLILNNRRTLSTEVNGS